MLDVAQRRRGRSFRIRAFEALARRAIAGAQRFEPATGFALEVVEGAHADLPSVLPVVRLDQAGRRFGDFDEPRMGGRQLPCRGQEAPQRALRPVSAEGVHLSSDRIWRGHHVKEVVPDRFRQPAGPTRASDAMADPTDGLARDALRSAPDAVTGFPNMRAEMAHYLDLRVDGVITTTPIRRRADPRRNRPAGVRFATSDSKHRCAGRRWHSSSVCG